MIAGGRMTLEYIQDKFDIGDRLIIKFTTVNGSKQELRITLEEFRPDYALGEGIRFWNHNDNIDGGGYRSNICVKDIEFIDYDYDEDVNLLMNIN
jgi:hypothetical protein